MKKGYGKLRGLRAEYGYTQHEMAEKLGIGVATYRKKELGVNDFTVTEAREIGRIFNREPDSIFFSH